MKETCLANPCDGCPVQGLIDPKSIRQASATVENVLANESDEFIRSGNTASVYAVINLHSQFEHPDRAFGTDDESEAVLDAVQKIVRRECESRQTLELVERI